MKKSRPDLSIPAVVLTASLPEEEIIRTVKAEADKFWRIPPSDQQECLTVLVALCDAIVWWTQRLKIKSNSQRPQSRQEAAGGDS
jgi:CheY-like chemotaxis protein